MKTSWQNRIERNLLPVSEEQQNVWKAIHEWYYTYECEDLEEEREDCELCGQENIRYQFQIQNKYNGNTLMIGSNCIKRFEIPIYDDEGRQLSKKEAEKLINETQNNLLRESKYRSVLKSLRLLQQVETGNFNVGAWIDHYIKNRSFTPRQLSTIYWRFREYNIPHTKSYFKISMRKSSEKEDFLKLQLFQFNQMKPSLTKHQIQTYESHLNRKK